MLAILQYTVYLRAKGAIGIRNGFAQDVEKSIKMCFKNLEHQSAWDYHLNFCCKVVIA